MIEIIITIKIYLILYQFFACYDFLCLMLKGELI